MKCTAFPLEAAVITATICAVSLQRPCTQSVIIRDYRKLPKRLVTTFNCESQRAQPVNHASSLRVSRNRLAIVCSFMWTTLAKLRWRPSSAQVVQLIHRAVVGGISLSIISVLAIQILSFGYTVIIRLVASIENSTGLAARENP